MQQKNESKTKNKKCVLETWKQVTRSNKFNNIK